MTGRDVLAAIEKGAVDPVIRAKAAPIFLEAAAKALAAEHTRKPGTIRASDAGRCVRELQAELQGKLDLPIDATTQLSRFDIGTIYGAWLASILKATLESEPAQRWGVAVEVDVERQGVPGHADAVIAERVKNAWQPVLTAEFKSTYGIKNKDLPSDKRFYQVAQVTHYALDKLHGSPMGTLITFAPAAWPAEDRFTFEDCDPAVYELRTDLEYARLSRALLTELQDGDPDQSWRCSSCRASWCEMNKNNAANVLELS